VRLAEQVRDDRIVTASFFMPSSSQAAMRRRPQCVPMLSPAAPEFNASQEARGRRGATGPVELWTKLCIPGAAGVFWTHTTADWLPATGHEKQRLARSYE